MIIQNRNKNQNTDTQNTHLIVRADGVQKQVTNDVMKEHRIDIYVQEQLVFQVVCTPTELVELVVGRLVTSGMIKHKEEIEILDICEQGNRAKVFLKEGISLRAEQAAEPTCCTDNKQYLQKEMSLQEHMPQLPRVRYEKEWIFHLAQVFAEGSMLHKKTKGTHCCYLAIGNQVIYAAEDIGRHNALDKVVGYALLQDYQPEQCILFTTGRVPTDMVEKTAAAGIPILVTKAVPTDEAIALAKQTGIQLICKAWPDSYEVFS